MKFAWPDNQMRSHSAWGNMVVSESVPDETGSGGASEVWLSASCCCCGTSVTEASWAGRTAAHRTQESIAGHTRSKSGAARQLAYVFEPQNFIGVMPRLRRPVSV